MLAGVQGFFPSIANRWRSYFYFDGIETLDALTLHNLGQGLRHVVWAGLLTGIPLMILTLLSQASMGGLNFSTEALGFKPEKTDPLKGLKRMVSLNALMELTKAILKVALLVSAAAAVIWPVFNDFGGYIWLSAGSALDEIARLFILLLIGMTIGLAIIGSFDLGYQMYCMNQKLKMSRQEIKDESKQSEGSPEVKGQIRQRQMKASRRV